MQGRVDEQGRRSRQELCAHSFSVSAIGGINKRLDAEQAAFANRESRSIWKDVLLALEARGLGGVAYLVCDDHAGAIRAGLKAAWQRCDVHFLSNALDYLAA